MIESIDFETLWNAILVIATAISGVFGWVKNQQAKMLDAYADEVQKFFDPNDTSVQVPPTGTPTASYTMSEAVRNFLVAGESEEDQKRMLEQVQTAEKKGLVEYRVTYSRGWYDIAYGQIAGAAKYC